MSEELLQTIPQQIGKYTYYRLGATSLAQLRKAGIIPHRDYKLIERKKPDGLVVYHGAIKAVVEYKQPHELDSPKKISKAINQEINVAKALCKILIVTDGGQTYWINAKTGNHILAPEGNAITMVFHPFPVRNTVALEFLLDEIDASIGDTNDSIRSAKLIDPTPLASRLWQTIWVATGKSPVKCLYNVVELFIFKFLSDLQVLPDDVAFHRIYNKAIVEPEEGLTFYAVNTRRKIYQLFPEGADGTTIINGTIFVNEEGEPNLSQSILFQRCLSHLNKYAEEFGSLTKIDKQFKTKLYESFLKQEVEALGQYFTPRKVIQSIIRMAGLDSPTFQFTGKRIADPFCGVGGFPLELLNLNESMREKYLPNQKGKIELPFTLHGFDKGFERDDERTIILAKANMLIYLAELLFKNPQCSKEFARVFNDTFVLFKDNLGTFGHIVADEANKYDVILSNPPYVTSGSSIIKEEIRSTPRTAKEYPINALGLEGLSLEWIVKSLRPGGKAFLIVPDGILGRINGKKLRDYILRECFLDAIVSLPHRTFFANAEHTYILAITKKHATSDLQTDPVFTYLVSNIGERLTSVKREEIDSDELPEMEGLFKMFSAAKGAATKLIEKQSGRCRIRKYQEFEKGPHWVIDRWWSKKDRIKIGALEDDIVASHADIKQLLAEFTSGVAEYDAFLKSTSTRSQFTTEVSLGNKEIFRLFIGKRYLAKELSPTQSSKLSIPVYSANVLEPMGYVESGSMKDFTSPSILWGIDGNFNFNLLGENNPFEPTDHCGVIQILSKQILPEYIIYALHIKRSEESFDRSFRASLANMRRMSLPIPILKSGGFDLQSQERLADLFVVAQKMRARVIAAKKSLDIGTTRYLEGINWGPNSEW
jgi:type I restriction enzyme M protein